MLQNTQVLVKIVDFLFLYLLVKSYGYFQFVRVTSALGFVLLAFQSYQSPSTCYLFIYVVLAILFQPVAEIALGGELWNVVDGIVELGLLLTSRGTKSEE